MARQPLERHRKIEHLLHQRFSLVALPQIRIHLKSLGNGDPQLVRDGLGDRVALRVSRVERSGDVAYGRLRLQRSEGDDLRYLVLSVLADDVVDDLLPSLDAEVDIYIRHAHALRIEESLKDEAVFDRVYLRDGEAVRHYAARSRAPARSDGDAVPLRVIYEVPYDEEVLHIAHVLDDLQLGLEPLPVLALRIHR